MITKADVEVRPLTSGPDHHFFGYYDKFPWNASGRLVLGMATKFIDRMPSGNDFIEIGVMDQERGGIWKTLARTRAWCWQQGCMLQWLPSAPDRLMIYNSRDGDHFVSEIMDVVSGETRTLPVPIYAVNGDGRKAVTLNFSRVFRMRPGYGYPGVPDKWANDPRPAEDGISLVDLETGKHKLIVSIGQIAAFSPDDTMKDAEHWFNHLQFNTEGSRFLFLHRWRFGVNHWRTRLFTANPDGSELYCVSDHGMVSHFDWRDESHILAWATRNGIGDRLFLFTDKSQETEIIGEGILTQDGHCSYSPDRRWILTDTYPHPETKRRKLLLFRPEDNLCLALGEFYSPPEISGEFRCDLHPRWSRDGKQVCIDSVHEGARQMYAANVSNIV